MGIKKMGNLIVFFVFVGIFGQSFSAEKRLPGIGDSEQHRTNFNNWLQNLWTNITQCKLRLGFVCDSTSPTIQIPEGYEGSAELGYHKLHTELTTWNKARQMCLDEGAHLAIPDSEEEAEKMIKMINEAEPESGGSQEAAYVGVHDIFEEGDWITIFDEPISSLGYDIWTPKWGGPDSTRNQNCATMHVSGGIDDIPCANTRWFICEYTPEEN